MNIEYHILATIPAATGVYFVTFSPLCCAGMLVGGILIDVDHILEFWYDCGFSLSICRFFSFCNSGINSKIFVPLHSGEFVVILILLGAFIPPLKFFLYGTAFGTILHLVLDFFNLIHRFRYRQVYAFLVLSFIFRGFYRFDRERIELLAIENKRVV